MRRARNLEVEQPAEAGTSRVGARGRRPAIASTNARDAKKRWPTLTVPAIRNLRSLSEQFHLSIAAGDLIWLERSWYVTHTGLLRVARRKHCVGIDVRSLNRFCDPIRNCWAFKATVFKSRTCKGFVGYGDADPSNVSPQVRGAEMRVAETRAVNRALRKAYGIGICSVEELGTFSGPLPPAGQMKKPAGKPERVNGNGHRPLRDRLCLLIRQHHLDPVLVKAYAAEYCEVSELRQASREQVATFIKHLAEYAQSDREGLLCQLNSYAPKPVCPATVMPPGTPDAANQEKEAGAA